MFEEENLRLVFTHVDANGNVDFRDAIVFSNVTELRNTSQAEREAMFQERYEHFISGGDENPEIPEVT